MGDDTTSVTAALFGLAGFEILAAAEVGGELELLVQTTAGLPPGWWAARGAGRSRGQRTAARRGCATSRWVGGRW
jgi:hypothetical protein